MNANELSSLFQNQYKNLDRLHLLRLTGNTLERGRQHGLIIKEILSKTKDPLALKVLGHKNQVLIERALRTKLLGPVYENLILKVLVPRLPKDIREIVDTTIEASGTDKKDAWLSLFQPDMVMVLAAVTTERYRNLFLEGAPGCSSAIVTKSSEHPFYFSRNLDYPAASAWERWPTIFYHEPDEGQKYFHVASLGIHTAGLTAANESGIAFSLHAHFSKKFSLGGMPILFAGDQLLPKARTLNEAIDILRKFKPIGNWAFNLASFSENKAVSVELSEGKTFVREVDHKGSLAHTNGFQNEELWPNQLHFTTSVVEDLSSRKSVIEAFLEKRLPEYTLNDAFMALASHQDYMTGQNRVFGNTVSVVTTIQSIVFEPHTQSLYVSRRAESPTGLGPYLKLPFDWNNLTDEHLHQKPLPVDQGLSDEFLKAVHYYHRAYVAWTVDHLTEVETLAELKECARLAPTDPHVLIQKGTFELKLHQYADARDSYQAALKFAMSPNLQHAATYFLGVALDLMGSRDGAINQYMSIIEGKVAPGVEIDPKIRRRVLKRLKKPFKSSDCQKIQPDLQFVEPIDYP